VAEFNQTVTLWLVVATILAVQSTRLCSNNYLIMLYGKGKQIKFKWTAWRDGKTHRMGNPIL